MSQNGRMRETINPSTLHDPPGYSHVVRVSGGTTIYLAGQVAWDSDRNVVGPGDFEAQTRQVLTNLVAVLDAAGAKLADLVKIGIYVVDHNDEKIGIIRRVRDEYFGDMTPPVSTLLGVERLAAPGLMIEIDGIAFLKG